MRRLLPLLSLLLPLVSCLLAAAATPPPRPHIVLVMADDMGWGQTSYNGHPLLKTPHLDAMAAAGLRFDRFYAGAANCSPTRATVMTGRTNDRTGTQTHGYALRLQEKTIARALRDAGYATGHFGKWHLNGFRGPGAPILGTDTHSPGAFGFDEWLSVTNFFDRNPLLSRRGKFEEHEGDSSEIIVREALAFIGKNRAAAKPTFSVIWYGSPHSPFIANDADRAAFASLPVPSQNHHGELVAMDRSIGALRRGLRELGLADNTLLWFCSDNGGLPEITPSTVGGLRGFKNTLYEGGLRVPGLVEWPAVIKPRVTLHQAGTVDIFPTIADVLGLPGSVLLKPSDGVSLKPLFAAESGPRAQPLGFRHTRRAAWLDGSLKLVTPDVFAAQKFELYDLAADPAEARDLAAERPADLARLKTALLAWHASVEASVAGRDYPEGRVNPGEPESRDWTTAPEYAPHLAQFAKRPEFQSALAPKGAKKEKKK
ncbi:MAG: sulfatase-like hydrolase/transferase [Opitutaceae bacterium]|nr:sulfatase-like hydrolase/transferase [Opitutaceae bacterium]